MVKVEPQSFFVLKPFEIVFVVKSTTVFCIEDDRARVGAVKSDLKSGKFWVGFATLRNSNC